MAMRTAPPAMSSVPSISQNEKAFPRMTHAKNAFHKRETAPSGARMTTGSDAIWTMEPRMLEVTKITTPRIQRLQTVVSSAQRNVLADYPHTVSCIRPSVGLVGGVD